MSKRWKVRKSNAAKLEKHFEVIDRFYGNVIGLLEKELEKTKQQIKAKEETK